MLKAAMQYSILLQQNVLESLYVGQVAIKLVNRQNFWAKSSGMIKHPPVTLQKQTLLYFPRKGDCLTDCPSNMSHYIAVFYHSHSEGVLRIGKFRS